MPVFGNRVKTKWVRLPGCKEYFYRTYIQVDEKWREYTRVFDCERHLHIKDLDMDICIASGNPELIQKEYIKPCGAATVCTKICAFKKARAKKELEEHGPWLSDELKEHFRKVLESEEDT